MENYLSVSEYANLYGKDTGNIRRLLASGRLPGRKIGKQWVIAADAVYPKDKREITGNYRNWRKKTALNHNKELMKTISDMVRRLCSIYGERLDKIVLYGSYARGTQTEDSDIDIAIFLADKPPQDVTDKMVDCVSSFELECGKVLSVIDISSKQFSQWKDSMPFYKNIQKEGIVLWKAAT